jgi:hypothetical protein
MIPGIPGSRPRKVWLLAVTAILFFTLVLVGSGKFSILGPNTSAQSVPCGTYPGNLVTTTGGGQFPAQSGENSVGNGIAAAPYEIFEKTSYYYAWTDQGVSEAIIVEGRILGCGFIGASISGSRYSFFISTNNGASWDVFKQSDLGGPDGNELDGSQSQAGTFVCAPTQNQQYCADQGDTLLATRIVRIHGNTYVDGSGTERAIIDGAWLKVVVQVQANQWFDMATDIAVLRSAIPAVQWTKSLYAVGDTAVVNYNIPTVLSTGSTAYFLTVTNLNTNTAISGLSNLGLSQLSGQISFPVTSDMFNPTTSNPNRIRATIASQIFNAAMQDTATIDNPSLAPTVTSVRWNKPFYREGDQVVINITAVPNSITNTPIATYYVFAHVGGIKYYDGFTTSATVTFTAANAGPLTVEVTAHDNAGRPSSVARFTEAVGPAIGLCVQYPQIPQCSGGGGNFQVPSYWILIMALSLAIGLVLLLVGLYMSVNPLIRLPFIAIGALLTVVGVGMFAVIVINFLASLFSGAGPIVKW